jgi:hypothetical protein
MELLKACPVCKKSESRPHLVVEDCLVSHEHFALSECASCGFVYTTPRPLEEEIGRYYQSNEYVSHNDTGKGIIHFLYQRVKSITLSQKYQLLQSLLPNKNISMLDYGCGTGSFAAYVSAKGHPVSGLEPDAGARSIAKSKIKTVSLACIGTCTPPGFHHLTTCEQAGRGGHHGDCSSQPLFP